MNAALDELTHYAEFDYLVVNDVFETALEALRAIILGNRQRRAIQEARYADLLRALLS
jgi:guanylate kinase